MAPTAGATMRQVSWGPGQDFIRRGLLSESWGSPEHREARRLNIHPPRLALRPPTSRRFRCLTATALRPVLGFERTEDVAGAAPRAHQLGIIAEPVPHHPVERANLLHDLDTHRFQIGAR